MLSQPQSDFLKLFFREGEHICVTPYKFAYKSVAVKDMDSDILALEGMGKQEGKTFYYHPTQINGISVNPCQGERQMSNVTSYRNFMIEMDGMDLFDQKLYVDTMRMPYNCCIFSGNKSLHFGISLDQDLPNAGLWNDIMVWILNIMDKADQTAKDSVRSIRFPDNIRKDSGKKQTMIEFNPKPTSLEKLIEWLNQYPDKNPRLNVERYEERPDIDLSGLDSNEIMSLIPDWVKYKLSEGIFFERNITWFKVSYAIATNTGLGKEDIKDLLTPFFIPENDFDFREWTIAINSGADTAKRKR
jgi:hypothetical protein